MYSQVVLALRRQMQADLHEFDPSLVYRVASRTARATLRKPCLETQYKKNKRRGGGEKGEQEETTMCIKSLSQLKRSGYLLLRLL